MQRKTSGWVAELAKTVAIAVLIAVGIRTIAFEPFESDSMSGLSVSSSRGATASTAKELAPSVMMVAPAAEASDCAAPQLPQKGSSGATFAPHS